MGFSLPHIAIVACVVVLLFGSGKISALMGDVGKGISSFKQGLKDDELPQTTQITALPDQADAAPVTTSTISFEKT